VVVVAGIFPALLSPTTAEPNAMFRNRARREIPGFESADMLAPLRVIEQTPTPQESAALTVVEPGTHLAKVTSVERLKHQEDVLVRACGTCVTDERAPRKEFSFLQRTAAALATGQTTPDLGGRLSTKQMGQTIMRSIEEMSA
jgi:hypothetical protein